MGHPTYGSFFEIFITILDTNTLKPYPTYGSFYPKITSKNMTHKLGYDCISVESLSASTSKLSIFSSFFVSGRIDFDFRFKK